MRILILLLLLLIVEPALADRSWTINPTAGPFSIIDSANLTTGQSLYVYNTTDSTTAPVNYERLEWTWVSNIAVLRTLAGGSGTARGVDIRYSGTTTPAVRIPATAVGSIELASGVIGAGLVSGRVKINPSGGSTATSGSHTEMTVEGGPVPSATSTLDWRGLDIKPTINFSNGTPGAGSYTALRISTTETALPTGSNYLIRALSGAAASTERFAVTNTGEMSASGISADGSGKVVCIKSDGFLGTCSSVVGAGGTCTCG